MTMLGRTALEERDRIVQHVMQGATHLLGEAMRRYRDRLEAAEIVATATEEIACCIAEGDHWKEFV